MQVVSSRSPTGSTACCLLFCLAFLLPCVHSKSFAACSSGSFGPSCNLSCTEHCDFEANCNSSTDGGCTVRCQKGWKNLPLCNTLCEPNWFSYNCALRCHCANATEVCDRKNGNCQSGCDPRWAESSCHVRMPEITNPPWIVESGCARFLVAFRPFNSTLDVGVGNVGFYQIESAVVGRDLWTERANVTGSPYQAWVDVGSVDPSLQHQFRVRIFYRSADFYERFAPPGNSSAASSVDCAGTTPGSSTSTQTTTLTTTLSSSSVTTDREVTDKPSTDGATTTADAATTSETPSPTVADTSATSSATSPQTTAATSAPPGPADSMGLIVALCIVLFLALCIAAAVLWCRLRGRFPSEKKLPPPGVAMTTMGGQVSLAEPRSARYWTPITDLIEPRRPVLSGPIASSATPDNSHGTADLTKSDGQLSFQAEFDSLPRGHQPHRQCEVARRLENASKNATPLCFPYDYNRVTFKGDEDAYYNASVMKGYVRRDAYIAAQSPMDDRSAELLWRAVLEQNVAQVVAAGGSQEHLAFQYWPEAAGQTLSIGGVTVRCESRQRRHEFTVTRLRVNGMRVTHYQLACRAADTLGLVAMYIAVRSAARIEDGPMLVHCRTGIGATCVFIGLDWLLQQAARENGSVSVCKCARDLRRGRPNALPDARQYALLYDALFEAFLRRSFLAVPSVSAIDAFMAAFDRRVMPSAMTALQEQLDLLTRLGPVLDEPKSAAAVSGTAKVTFDNHREAEVVFCFAPPSTVKPDDAAAVTASRNAFWLDVLHRQAIIVAILDSSAANTASVLPASALLASDSGEQKPTLELPDLQISFPAVKPDADTSNSHKSRTLIIRPRTQGSTTPGTEDASSKIELLMLSWKSAPVDGDSFDEDSSIADLANAVAALTAAASRDTVEGQCILVDADTRRCGLLAVAAQTWHQLIEDGYADLCAVVRRRQRRCGGDAAIDAREYRMIHRCLQRLASWRRRRPLPEGRRKRRGGGRRRERSSDNTFEYEADQDSLWLSLTSTLESGGDELESSIYDYCQLPVRPRADLAASPVYINLTGVQGSDENPVETEPEPIV
ncbi:hypothetical protein BOX15_Mlig024267g3 [Macrostomum lignano]|uniref:protein-tyrosine-phosphatase n=1 Tax=Macrostomum lignano TaxID=282301 RepID=A0A267G1G2_9PLAT|nr:hypothetical protein BOX15_Mlig024267g3 [Macrostomum lignano]